MASPLQKKNSNISQNSKNSNQAQNQLPISENVIVMEKEFKSKKSHQDEISHLIKISDTEFISSSWDKSFKIWDSQLQGCSYTYETHEPLHRMRITGELETNKQLITSQGDGNFFVMGLKNRNQNAIITGAHDAKIIQICTLEKLKNKYFATRCIDGDVSLWSSTSNPDRVFIIENIDMDENQSTVQDTNRDSQKEADIPPVILEEQKDDEEVEQNEEEEVDEDGNPIKKKKPKAVVVVKKDKSGRISSEKDQMIEFYPYNYTQIQSSATVLCFSNYRESFVNIATIDLKTRRKQNIKRFELNSKPTYLFQVDANNLFIGTEGGCIEHWQIDSGNCQEIYAAHPESHAGISKIIDLKTQSQLLRGEPYTEASAKEFRLLASCSYGAKEFRLWKLRNRDSSLHAFLKIETTIQGGIMYLLETSATQIVAANSKVIKFYDFIDKNEKEDQERTKKYKEEVDKIMKEIFQEIIQNQSNQNEKDNMKIESQNLQNYVLVLYQKVGKQFMAAAQASDECFEDVWFEFDLNETGYISWHQIKPFIHRLEEHEIELQEERRILEEAKQRKLEELRKKQEEEEMARILEEERLAALEGSEEYN